MALCPDYPVSRYQKGTTNLDLLEQEIQGGHTSLKVL